MNKVNKLTKKEINYLISLDKYNVLRKNESLVTYKLKKIFYMAVFITEGGMSNE